MKKLAVLMVTVFIDMLGFAMIFPLLPYYAERLHAEPWVIGFIFASYSLAQILLAPLWGAFSDRYGRRPALLIGLSCSGAAFLIFGLATSVWMLFLSRIVQGAGGGLVGVSQAWIGDVVDPGGRAKALGWLSAASSAGVMLGPALGSAATRLGPAFPGFFAAALCVVNLAFAWRWLSEPSRPARHEEASSGQAAGPARRTILSLVAEVLREPRRPVSRLIWIYTLGMLGFMSSTAILSLYLEARFGVSVETIGFVFLYVGAMSLTMRGAILGRLLDRFGQTRVLQMGAVCLAVGLAALPLPSAPVTFAAVLTLVPIGTACLFPATSALISDSAPAAELGQTLGVQQAFGNVARVLAPIWATAAFQKLGPAVPFPIAGTAVAVVVLISWSLPDRESLTQPAPAT